MLNVNALRKTLSRMELPELQAYATAHKNDPYVVAMALSVANIKKETKVAQQGSAGAQQQPKVVDQDIAAIVPHAAAPAPQGMPLPEESGIGQLPAPAMQKLAGGGIVAFGEGGDVPGYAEGTIINAPSAGTEYGIPGLVVGAPFTGAANPDLAARIAEIEALPSNRFSRDMKDQMIADARVKADAALTALRAAPTQISAPTPTPMANPRAGVQSALPQTTTPPDTGAPAPDKTGAGINKTLPSGQGIGFGASPAQSAAKWFTEQLPEKEIAQAEEDYVKKRQAVWDPVNSKLAGMIDAEKSKLKSDKEENFYMALVQGGLAAAAGTSPNALQNIAAGLGQGAKIYGEGLKDLRQAAKEVGKMEMDQAKAEAAQKIGDMDAYEKYSDKVADRNAKIDQLKASGLGSIAQASVSGEYSLAGHREQAAAYREQAKAYKDAQTEQRDIAQVQSIYDKHYAEVINDARFKVNAVAARAEARRRTDEDLKKFPRLAQYAGLPTTSGANGATGSTTGWGQATVIKP